jgi:hypothetical protein
MGHIRIDSIMKNKNIPVANVEKGSIQIAISV